MMAGIQSWLNRWNLNTCCQTGEETIHSTPRSASGSWVSAKSAAMTSLTHPVNLPSINKYMAIKTQANNDHNIVLPNTGTSMHCAFAGNVFYQLVGQKYWTFIEPEYSPYLLPHYETHVFAGFARAIPSWI